MGTFLILEHEIKAGMNVRFARGTWCLRRTPGRGWRQAPVGYWDDKLWFITHLEGEHGAGCVQENVVLSSLNDCCLEDRACLPVEEYRALVADGALLELKPG